MRWRWAFSIPKSIVPSRAAGVGSVLLLFGSATGREGLHGATFASQDLDPAKQTQNRSSVQVGDPFTGKLLMEASLELARQPYVLGLQDLGAAGLLCASSEMAFHGEGGAIIDLDCVHTRGEGLQPWELLLSETQERMLVCVEASHVEDAIAIVERWELPARVVGTVVKEPFYILRHKGEELLRATHAFLDSRGSLLRSSLRTEEVSRSTRGDHESSPRAGPFHSSGFAMVFAAMGISAVRPHGRLSNSCRAWYRRCCRDEAPWKALGVGVDSGGSP